MFSATKIVMLAGMVAFACGDGSEGLLRGRRRQTREVDLGEDVIDVAEQGQLDYEGPLLKPRGEQTQHQDEEGSFVTGNVVLYKGKNPEPLADEEEEFPNDKTPGIVEEGALFEGDIVPDYATIMEAYGPEVVTELEKEGILQEDQSDIVMRQSNTNKRWSIRVNDVVEVPYTLSSGFSSSHRSVIENAVTDLGDRSKVVKFVPRTSQSKYVNVIRGDGCYSHVGSVGNGVQELSLGTNCVSKGVVQHEFLHALGFYHEQSRPDRDNFVTINWENIETDPDRTFNFEKRQQSDSLGSPYDYGSVMHYREDAFSKNGQDTISAPRSIGQQNGADDEDIRQVQLLYQCRSDARSFTQFNANPCTSDCKCWEGARGCDGNSDACQGDLVCSSDQCVKPSSGGSTLTFRSRDDTNKCFDLRGADTTNGSRIILYPCNGTPAQKWIHDSQNRLRSAVNVNKCVVGNGGDTVDGTFLMIWDCYDNDSRFQFNRYTDGTIRPRKDTNQCVDVARSILLDGNNVVLYWECHGGDNQKWEHESGGRRNLSLE